MAARIYTRFRELIGDSSSPYTISDNLVYQYLDTALERLSSLRPISYIEDIDIDATDLSNGYFTTTKDPIDFPYSVFGKHGEDWYISGYNRVYLVDTSGWTPQVLTDTKYTRYLNRFKGATKEDADLDHPQALEFAIVLYACGAYLVGESVTQADGSMAIAKRRKEDSLEVEYDLSGKLSEFGSPSKMMEFADSLFLKYPGSTSNIFTIKI